MNRDGIAAILHILIVVAVYAIYTIYPSHAVPIPYFDTLCYIIGTLYGIAGVLMLKSYAERSDRTQTEFNMAVLVIVAGGLIFMAESIGNAA